MKNSDMLVTIGIYLRICNLKREARKITRIRVGVFRCDESTIRYASLVITMVRHIHETVLNIEVDIKNLKQIVRIF